MLLVLFVDVPSGTDTGSAQFIAAVRAVDTQSVLGWSIALKGFPIDTLQLLISCVDFPRALLLLRLNDSWTNICT
jgi:hypothetical protein